MAKKTTTGASAKPRAPRKTVSKKATGVASTTAVRNSPVPKVAAIAAAPVAAPVPAATPAPKRISHEDIAVRAYLISRSGFGGSEDDNWLRAEQELRSGV